MANSFILKWRGYLLLSHKIVGLNRFLFEVAVVRIFKRRISYKIKGIDWPYLGGWLYIVVGVAGSIPNWGYVE
jgi:hypothetical protein